MADVLIGIAELNKRFQMLGDDIKIKTGRQMVASAASIIRAQAKQNVQNKGLVKTRALLTNIVVKRETSAPSGTVQYNVGVRHGKNLTRKQKLNSKVVLKRANGRIKVFRQNDPFYWRFIEFGHKTVRPASAAGQVLERKYLTTLRNGVKKWRKTSINTQSLKSRRLAAVGYVQPEPFLRPALDQKYSQAITKMADILNKALSKAQS